MINTKRLRLVALFIGLLSISTLGQTSEDHNSPSIEGSWSAAVTIDQGPTILALVTYGAGGGLTESDILFPPSQVSTGHGNWSAKRRTVNNTIVKLNFDPQGQFAGTIKVREQVILSRDGSEYTGRGKAEIFDLQGNLLVAINYTTHGRRIGVQQL